MWHLQSRNYSHFIQRALGVGIEVNNSAPSVYHALVVSPQGKCAAQFKFCFFAEFNEYEKSGFCCISLIFSPRQRELDLQAFFCSIP